MSVHCSACGEAANEDDLDCVHCGEPLDGDLPEARSSSTRPMVIVLVVGLGLGAICVLAGIVMAIAIPNLLKAQQAGNEAAAIGSLKTIGTAQAIFREGDKDQDGALDYGSLDDLQQAQLVDSVLGGGIKSGYVFFASQSVTTPEFLWMATASPMAAGTTGSRYFAITNEGVIYYSETAPIPLDLGTCQPPAARLKSGDIRPVR